MQRAVLNGPMKRAWITRHGNQASRTMAADGAKKTVPLPTRLDFGTMLTVSAGTMVCVRSRQRTSSARYRAMSVKSAASQALMLEPVLDMAVVGCHSTVITGVSIQSQQLPVNQLAKSDGSITASRPTQSTREHAQEGPTHPCVPTVALVVAIKRVA